MRRRPLAPLHHKGASLYFVFILVITLGALAFRLPRLSMRPMHTDEAVHADKFRTLLEDGDYTYDPNDYHGPTLNYFTLIPAWLQSARTYTEITEFTLRIVPVAFGVLLVLSTVLVADGLSGRAAIVAAVLAAISPSFVFYNRYYIQESLLAFFTFAALACGYRYARSRRLGWAVLAGVSLGLMHATKETCIIAFGAMGLALVVLLLLGIARGQRASVVLAGLKGRDLALGAAAAILISALFYSSFLSHPSGILDSYRTYATYLGRGGGEESVHIHPWYYYLRMLLFWKFADGPIWTEGLIVVLAVIGAITAFQRKSKEIGDRGFVRFLAVYTIALTLVYSLLPYKTPWCVLNPLHGMILLAGVGATALVTWMPRRGLRIAAAAVLTLAGAHLFYEAYRANFVYEADSRNPYVYAHPTPEVFTIVEKVQEYAQVYDDPCDLVVQVACTGSDYWPLPWYLRFYRTGCSSGIPKDVGSLILISADLEDALAHKLYAETPAEQRHMYLYLFDEPYYVWFRPGVKLVGFVRRDLWERYNQQPDPTELLKKNRDEETGKTGNAAGS